MSTTPRDGPRHPLASSSSTVSLHHTPNVHSLHRYSPSSLTQRTSTPPAPSAANISATLRAFRHASAPSSVAGSEAAAFAVTSPTVPQVVGVSAASTPALHAPAATTSEDILRGIYNEKLHASVRSIITTLTSELPADHIFLQLLADPSTQQYCKVRLAEVVEGFLYSTQAAQYHELATELARREQENETQRLRIEELEAALASARNETQLLQLQLRQQQQQQQQQEQMIAQLQRDLNDGLSSRVSRSPPTPPSHAKVTESSAEVNPAGTAPNRLSNPMEDEEARRELLRVLEQATHDQELHRCRQALQAVAKVVAVTAAAPTFDDPYFFEGELVGQLYTCVQSLMQYVDSALESQERLRREVHQEHHPWAVVVGNREATNTTRNDRDDATTEKDGLMTGSDYSTPRRPRVTLGEVNTLHDTRNNNPGSVFSSAVSSRLSSASAARPPLPHPVTESSRNSRNHNSKNLESSEPSTAVRGEEVVGGVDEIQQRRRELQRLAQQLRSGQQYAQSAWEQLSTAAAQHRRDVTQLQRSVVAARSEAADAAAAAADDVRAAKEKAERVRLETLSAAAAERTTMREKLADVQAQLATAKLDVEAARREVGSLTTRLENVQNEKAEVAQALSTEKAVRQEKELLLREQQKLRAAFQAELTSLKAAHQATEDALLDAARELLCLRVEKTMSGLSALYQESKAAKADLLEREGYRHLCNAYSTAAASQQEVARHAQAQLQGLEAAQREAATAQQHAMDALGALLRSLWADDATETATGDPAAYDGNVTSAELSGNARTTTSTTTAAAAAATENADEKTEIGFSKSSKVDSHAENTTGASQPAHKYRMPTTLAGICAALDFAYANVQARHRARQKAIDSLRTTLIGKDIELRAAQANDAQLRELLRAERAKEEQWRLELAQLGAQNPMRDLLARQDALLKAVSEERNALRLQWNSLSGDYIALEQRNGVLHARCAEKEHENARLSGMLLRGATSSTSTPRPAAPAAATSATTSSSVTAALRATRAATQRGTGLPSQQQQQPRANPAATRAPRAVNAPHVASGSSSSSSAGTSTSSKSSSKSGDEPA